MARLKKSQAVAAAATPRSDSSSHKHAKHGKPNTSMAQISNKPATTASEAGAKKKRKRKRKARTEVSSSSESESDSDSNDEKIAEEPRPNPQKSAETLKTARAAEPNKETPPKEKKKDKKKARKADEASPPPAEAVVRNEKANADAMDVDDDGIEGKVGNEEEALDNQYDRSEPSSDSSSGGGGGGGSSSSSGGGGGGGSSSGSGSDSSGDSDPEAESEQGRKQKKSFHKSSEIPQPLRLMRDPDMDTCAKFEEYYMGQLTKEFGDDLDKIRQAKDFGEKSLPMLVRALKAGTSTFTKAEKKVAVEAGG